jgi:two-component system, NarL family, sensor histidine kinase UhpB
MGVAAAAAGAGTGLAIYRVAQESLTNVARHANAQSVELELTHVDRTVILGVRDDGRGIPHAEVFGQGTGLAGMRERAVLAGGRLTVQRRPEGGPRCASRCPCEGRESVLAKLGTRYRVELTRWAIRQRLVDP